MTRSEYTLWRCEQAAKAAAESDPTYLRKRDEYLDSIAKKKKSR